MIAAYQRISRADGDLGKDGKDKSNSIENQKELILRYISCKESLQNVPVMDFVDDGYTGSNFDRPGFQQMMDGVRNGKIDTIIVKDLSCPCCNIREGVILWATDQPERGHYESDSMAVKTDAGDDDPAADPCRVAGKVVCGISASLFGMDFLSAGQCATGNGGPFVLDATVARSGSTSNADRWICDFYGPAGGRQRSCTSGTGGSNASAGMVHIKWRENTKMKLAAIHHVAIIVSDYEKARDFYVNKLGFAVVRENFRKERNDWKLDLRVGDGVNAIELEIFAEPNPPKRVNRPEACGLRHLAFRVEDVEAAVAELAQMGIECEPIRLDSYTKKKMTFFFDPDGLPLELHE